MVSWTDESGQGGDTSISGIKAQIFDATGAKVGTEFLVNSATLGNQWQPDITSLASGGFVVSWSDSVPGRRCKQLGIKAQIFSASGVKVGSEFLVNSATLNRQEQPTITSLASGGFVVSWSDGSGENGDASGSGILARVFTLQTIEGTTDDDTLFGTSTNDTIDAFAGNDQMFGLAGNDTLNGGADDDTLDGGEGDDTLDGGTGSDYASYSSATSRVVINLGMGIQDTLGAGTDTFIGIENLIGSAFDDALIGRDEVDNILQGGTGNDYLAGRDGNDTLIGGAGHDTLDGESGLDTARTQVPRQGDQGGFNMSPFTFAPTELRSARSQAPLNIRCTYAAALS